MGLFDIFKKKEAPATSTAPASPSTSRNVAELHAPISGKAIRMAEVPDPVFSNEILGKGCAIWPEDDVVTSPVAGEVTVTMGHAVGIMSESGVEVLVHVGVDTVNLEGKGFTSHVKLGDTVTVGQPLLKMDRSAIAEADYKDCVILVVSNSADFTSIDMAVDADASVDAGTTILKVTR